MQSSGHAMHTGRQLNAARHCRAVFDIQNITGLVSRIYALNYQVLLLRRQPLASRPPTGSVWLQLIMCSQVDARIKALGDELFGLWHPKLEPERHPRAKGQAGHLRVGERRAQTAGLLEAAARKANRIWRGGECQQASARSQYCRRTLRPVRPRFLYSIPRPTTVGLSASLVGFW